MDNDGHLDRVGGAGADLSISFGAESGFTEPHAPRDLLGFRFGFPDEEEKVVAAVADFDGDGWLDLVIAATAPRQVGCCNDH